MAPIVGPIIGGLLTFKIRVEPAELGATKRSNFLPGAIIGFVGGVVLTLFLDKDTVGGTLPIRKLGALPGSLGSYAGVDLRIPTITLELPRGVERLDPEDLWELYGSALVASIIHLGSLRNKSSPRKECHLRRSANFWPKSREF